MPDPMDSFETWMLQRVAQAVEAGEVSEGLLTELKGELEQARELAPAEGHALAVQEIAERLDVPVEHIEQMLTVFEAQPPVTRQGLLRRLAEAWLEGQREAVPWRGGRELRWPPALAAFPHQDDPLSHSAHFRSRPPVGPAWGGERTSGHQGLNPPRGANRTMATRPERRHTARLPIPAQLSGPALDEYRVGLLDLSPQGARIEHVRRLPDWSICFLDLPRALGGTRLQGQVIWSQVAGRTTLADGKRVLCYQSGLRFSELTREQDAGLVAALNILGTTPEG